MQKLSNKLKYNNTQHNKFRFLRGAIKQRTENGPSSFIILSNLLRKINFWSQLNIFIPFFPPERNKLVILIGKRRMDLWKKGGGRSKQKKRSEREGQSAGGKEWKKERCEKGKLVKSVYNEDLKFQENHKIFVQFSMIFLEIIKTGIL